MRNTYFLHEKNCFLFLTAAFFSIALSYLSAWRETVINPDAICYLLSAEAIAQSGWQAVMHTCPQAEWPLYSMMIFSVSHLSSLSFLSSAYLLDGLFSLLSVITFIFIVKELGGSKRVLWLAMLVILLSHEFNSVRQYIVRDHGFWSFYLLSIFFLLRYLHHPAWPFAAGFTLSLVAATLFRVEGAVFLAVVPFVFFLMPSLSFKERVKYFLTLYAPLLLMGALLVASHHLGRLAEVTHQLKHGFMLISGSFHTAKTGLAQYVLAPEAARDAGLLLFLGLVVWYAVYAVINLSWGYFFLAMYAWYNRSLALSTHHLAVFGAYFIVNISITFIFFAQHLFLSKRYLIALSLIFMLFVPFALNTLLLQWQKQEKHFFLIMSIVLVLFSASGGIIHFGHSKNYIHEAGDWMAGHVPHEALLYANDYQLMYYSKHFGQTIFRTLPIYLNTPIWLNNQWKHYDYLALRLDKHDAAKTDLITHAIQLRPEKTWMNERGDRVVLYKIQEKLS